MIKNYKNNENFFILFLIILLFQNINGYIMLNENDKQIYCGTHLTQAIYEACPHGINSFPKGKRFYSKENNKGSFNDDNQYNDYEFIEYPPPLLSGLYNIDKYYQARNRRSLMINIVQECCKNPCSAATLRQYCN